VATESVALQEGVIEGLRIIPVEGPIPCATSLSVS